MPVKCSEISGFLVEKKFTLPGKGCMCAAHGECECGCGVSWKDYSTWNEAITQQGSVKLTLNREKLAERIWDTYYSKGQHPGGSKLIFDKERNDAKFWAYEQADAIISKEAELFEVVKEDK